MIYDNFKTTSCKNKQILKSRLQNTCQSIYTLRTAHSLTFSDRFRGGSHGGRRGSTRGARSEHHPLTKSEEPGENLAK